MLKDYGVRVKRQNGDEINKQEINQLKDSLDLVYSVFGNRKEMSEKFKLKISHAGEKRMHARKAVGLFIPSYNAIGVTFKDNLSGQITLAHEYAHFMDYWVGKKNKMNFDSDKEGNLANQIAKTFRDNMNKIQSSNYQNRTCECFARAFEQYFDNKVNGDKAMNHLELNQVPNKVFNEKIEPLIKQYLSENEEFLKSIESNLLILGVNN